jgi:hypothetical protein
MTSSDAHAGGLSNRHSRGGGSLLPRLLAIARAPVLDAELADGIHPSVSPAHRLRANHLCRQGVRRRTALALHRALADAQRGVPPRGAEIPLSREAINRCGVELDALAEAIATIKEPRTQGVAIASQLAFDGCGPLFDQPSMPDGRERLANTVRAALAALEVSSEFDRLED